MLTSSLNYLIILTNNKINKEIDSYQHCYFQLDQQINVTDTYVITTSPVNQQEKEPNAMITQSPRVRSGSYHLLGQNYVTTMVGLF